MKVKTLILCIDRDNDIGEKTGAEGPIIGRDKNIRVAKNLALKDPEDTDVNAIFGAVKIAEELDTEIATLTGDKNVGLVSDERISQQLDGVIEKFKPEGVILITDGAEDEQIIPIIQSRIKINSVRTIIVRQSKELEKAYFTITHFIKEIEKDPNLARLVFGIPGIALILLAIGALFGILGYAVNLILALFGIYLIIKGFGYEEEFFSRISEFLRSLSVERISTLTYIVSFILLLIGLGYGYDEVLRNKPEGMLPTLSTFIIGSSDMILFAIVIAILGRSIDDYASRKYLNIRRDIILLTVVLLVKVIAESAAGYWSEGTIGNFTLSMILGIIMFLVVLKVTKQIFLNEIQKRQRLISEFANRRVYTNDGRLLGRVSKVMLDGSMLVGLKIGKKKIPKEDIISNNGAVTVQG